MYDGTRKDIIALVGQHCFKAVEKFHSIGGVTEPLNGDCIVKNLLYKNDSLLKH